MSISFLTNNILAIMILMGYLSVSAYWCNALLLGNYTMLLRVHKMSFTIGIIVSIIGLFLCVVLGYRYFNKLNIYGKEQERV